MKQLHTFIWIIVYSKCHDQVEKADWMDLSSFWISTKFGGAGVEVTLNCEIHERTCSTRCKIVLFIDSLKYFSNFSKFQVSKTFRTVGVVCIQSSVEIVSGCNWNWSSEGCRISRLKGIGRIVAKMHENQQLEICFDNGNKYINMQLLGVLHN